MKINRHGQAAVFTRTDFSRLIQKTVGEKHKLIFRIAYYTAARMGEVVSLSTANVYRQDGTPLESITYEKSKTKTNQTRQVPVSPQLKEFLKLYWHNQKPNYSGYLFPGVTEENYLQFQSADDALRRALVLAGLESRGYSSHSFRRSAATNLSNNGVAVSIIREITGHSTLASLQRYIEVNPDQVQNAIATL